MIRPIQRRDLERINSIWEQHKEDFGLPDTSYNTITSAVVEEDGKLVGFGVVKVLAEATMVLDMEDGTVQRLNALQLLMDEAIRACREARINQLHVFVRSPNLSRLLVNKYGFVVVKDQALVLEV